MAAGLGAESTAEEAIRDVDLTDRTIVVTGGSAGLGVETIRVLAGRGARVVGVVRDPDKGEAALAPIREAQPDARIELAVADLSDLDSVRRGADEIAARCPRIDRLINNAGIMACPLERTKEGLDLQLGTNHLGHFVLTARLFESILAAAPARVVNLSSGGHRTSDFRFHDPFFEKEPYDKWTAYGQAKTANVLFSVALDKRYRDRGVRAYAVHPGAIETELGRHMTSEDREAMHESMPRVRKLVFKNVPQGAATSVWAATASELADVGGVYCEDCAVSGFVEDPTSAAAGVMPYALDEEAADRLWALSEEWSGERFPA